MSTEFLKMPPGDQARVTRELQPGEVVVWAGQPDPVRFMLGGFMLWLFFIPWTAFSLFWIAGAAGFRLPDFSGPASFFPLFGLPFLCIGLGGLASPLWLRLRARDVFYVITDRRALVLQGRRKVTVNAWLPAALAAVTRTERRDGSGDLVFSGADWVDGHGNSRQRRLGFIAVRDVRTVEMYLQRLAATSR